MGLLERASQPWKEKGRIRDSVWSAKTPAGEKKVVAKGRNAVKLRRRKEGQRGSGREGRGKVLVRLRGRPPEKS